MAQFIKYYSSFEAGAPQLTQAAGSGIGVIEACAVTGFNPKAISSITVASGVATAVCNGHGQPVSNVYEFDLDLTIEGASNSLVNGSKLITVVDANTFTFPAPGVPDGAVGGTLSCKRTPLGWTKPFSGTNEAMFGRPNPLATDHLLYVNDPVGEDMRIFGVESATAINAWIDKFPTELQMAGGYYWTKGNADTRAKNWMLLGDDFGMYFISEGTGYSNSANWRAVFVPQYFGDINTYKAGDIHHCLITGQRAAGSSSGPQPGLTHASHQWGGAPADVGANGHAALARSHNGLIKSVGAGFIHPSEVGLSTPNKWFPDVVSNGGIFVRGTFVDEYSTSQGHPIRGVLPGFVQPMFRAADVSFTEPPYPITMTDGSNEKLWMMQSCFNSNLTHMVAFTLNKAWR